MKIAVVGSYGVGMTMCVERVPRAGETVSGGLFSVGPGGKGSNQAIAAARLGADVELFTAVGPDSMANDARGLWAREGVSADHVVTGTRPTMTGIIFVENDGENRIAIAPGALDELTPDHVESFTRTIREADMLVVSMEIPMDVVTAAMRIASEAGTRVLLNPAPASALPEEAWAWVDILTPNESEAAILLGLDPDHGLEASELLAQLRKRTNSTVVLTLGGTGSLVDEGDGVVSVRPITADEVVDTTGAGDSFTAALAVALAEGEPLSRAVRRATAAGSYAVGVAGVIDALPYAADIDRLLASDDGTSNIQ